MKWYFASRMRHQEKIKIIATFLEEKGETFVSDWVYQPSLKPYTENNNEVQTNSSEVVRSVQDADIFVMISDKEGTDMFIELGIALGKHVTTKNNRLYIVGEHAKRSLMQLHPAIIHVKDVSELFSKEGIATTGVALPDFYE
jgi:hypothetical protein